MRVWMNGQVLEDPSGAAIAVDDHGFTVGDGVFEAVKVVDGDPFALTRHLERLARSATGLGLAAPDLDLVRAGVREVVDGATGRGRLRITYTAGRAPMGSGRAGGSPTLVVAYGPLQPYPATVAIATVPWPRNERGATAGLKTTSYAENVIALAHAAERGAGEAIFANTQGHLCEGTGSNVFYVVDGELRTPTLSSGCLAGVTRALLVEWTGAREVDEPLGEVRERASEVFLASTTRDVQPVSRWDERAFVAPGPVTERCAATWAAKERENLDP
jgi:branched-chain amino acid aminotransferase